MAAVVEVDAPVYYVAMTGNDDAPGTQSAPWQTIQHAVDSVLPGDTIVVMPGEYAGARIERSGTFGAYITLQGTEDGRAIINQPGPQNRHNSNLEIETWEGDGTVAYWIIERLTVRDAPNWGIDVRGGAYAHSHDIIIRNNTVQNNGWDNGTTGIFFAFTDYITVVDNTSSNNGEHGIYISNSSDHFTVSGNRLYENEGCGIHMNGDASMGGDGTISFGVVEKNVIYRNGEGGGSAINMDGVTDTVVHNNLLYDNQAGGIAAFRIDGAVCSHDNRFLHNTILMPADGRWAVNIGGGGCVNNELYNNILLSDHSYRGSIVLDQLYAGFASDYNIIIDRFSTDEGDSVLDLSEWQALGYDQHSFIAAPEQLFVDPSSHLYDLIAGSPAIDAGDTLPDVDEDIRGFDRPRGSGYDIGAYEFFAGSEWVYLPTIFVSE